MEDKTAKSGDKWNQSKRCCRRWTSGFRYERHCNLYGWMEWSLSIHSNDIFHHIWLSDEVFCARLKRIEILIIKENSSNELTKLFINFLSNRKGNFKIDGFFGSLLFRGFQNQYPEYYFWSNVFPIFLLEWTQLFLDFLAFEWCNIRGRWYTESKGNWAAPLPPLECLEIQK